MNHEDLYSRFINAFESIATALGGAPNRPNDRYKSSESFGALIDKARSKNSVIRENYDLLNEFRELRNYVQHGKRLNGLPMAIPNPEAVRQLEEIADRLIRPTPVKSVMVTDVLTTTESSAMHLVALRMLDNDLSQVPVVDDSGNYLWLLTTDTIARWLADEMKLNSGELIVDEVSVADLKDSAEVVSDARLVRQSIPAFGALDILSASNPPSAVVITENGESNPRVLGVLTRFDIPDISKKLLIKVQ